ncbi:MAG: hypothetical protein AAFV69_10035 [Pseudomonadota bacterium]
MKLRILTIAAALAMTVPAAQAKEGTVAGLPALNTESTEALIKQREKWGDKPSLSSADAVKQADTKK